MKNECLLKIEKYLGYQLNPSSIKTLDGNLLLLLIKQYYILNLFILDDEIDFESFIELENEDFLKYHITPSEKIIKISRFFNLF
jgi:hypothetical protein